MPWIAPVFSTVAGGLLTNKATNTVADAQAAADAARLAEEQRVRQLLRQDTGIQRSVADQAFADYDAGLITLAQAQERAANAIGNVQTGIAQNQLADTAKMSEMANFRPYSIKTATGGTFFDKGTGAAGRGTHCENGPPHFPLGSREARDARRELAGALGASILQRKWLRWCPRDVCITS